MVAELLPRRPQPPHDPTSWLLNARTGWKAVDFTHGVSPVENALALSLTQLPGSGRPPIEPSGSFAGLTPPANVAVGPGGDVYLLDATTLQLKRFDPCDCEFKTIPCFGGNGAGARQFRGAATIAICGPNLFVCDPGNHRISVFALHGYLLRAHWSPPPAQLPQPFEPFDLTFDSRRRLFVTDRANACVHRFAPGGHWETSFKNLGNVSFIATDCEDRLHVASDGTPAIHVLTSDGARAKPGQARFARMPFAVNADGSLHFPPCCLFDLSGDPILTQPPAPPPPPLYPTKGQYFSEALDSELYRCQWHRIILRGEIPGGTRVTVWTYTSEAPHTPDQITDPSNDRWQTAQIAQQVEGASEWDCLIQSGPGRYLWLKLEFGGNGHVTPKIDSIVIEFPRVSLRRFLPAVFGQESASADFTDRFLSIFDTTLRSIERQIDTQARLYDPDSSPATPIRRGGPDFLSWLGSWIGVSTDRNWPEHKRRQFIKEAGGMFDLRGTSAGLWRQLLLLLEMTPAAHAGCLGEVFDPAACSPPPLNCAPCHNVRCNWRPPPLILEHFRIRRWLFAGAGRLGDQAVLWGRRIVNRSQLDAGAQLGMSQLISTKDPLRDPFHHTAHQFTVFVPACWKRRDQDRRALENLLRAETPAHAHYTVNYVVPRFRIGVQSMIGFDSVIARLPQGVTLDATPLGPASIVGPAPQEQGGASMTVGKDARIGTTTTLT